MGMRWAVISDCHGNADALTAVLAEIDALGVSGILNLGDHASGPLAAAETLDLIMARDDMLSICGNHDRYLLGDPKVMGPSDAVAVADLKQAHLDWLATLPASRTVNGLFLCHGTPRSDETYWLETVSAAGQVLRRDRAEIEAEAVGIAAQILLCGHTHLPAIVQLSDGRLVVNPGSIGLPAYDDVTPHPHIMQSGDAAARYALLEHSGSNWHVSQRRVTYDASRMAALACSHAREDWAVALETGWFSQ